MSMVVIESGGVCSAKGFKASGVHCGLRRNRTRKDLALIVSDVRAAAASVYTQNVVKGAPILVTQAHLADGYAQAILCNSGNANTCNADGISVANAMCAFLSRDSHIAEDDIIIASTGVIGQPLPLEPIDRGMKGLVQALSYAGSDDAAAAIMTTDTVQKHVAVQFELDGKPCVVGGIAKGSGMIHPNMATMLAFVTTDVAITPAMLQMATRAVTQDTFNMVSVDGDTSTNDMLSVMANGLAGNTPIESTGPAYDAFIQALRYVCTHLAKAIARDGEGATRLVTCIVQGAQDDDSARTLAKSVISSSLVKTAIFGADANWGRILCALGYSGVHFNPWGVSVRFSSAAGSIDVCVKGGSLAFDEDLAKKILLEKEVCMHIEMQDGTACATAWGCDLTYDYVKINGDYRS